MSSNKGEKMVLYVWRWGQFEQEHEIVLHRKQKDRAILSFVWL